MSDSPRSGRWDILVPHCNDPEGGSTSNGEQDPVPWGSVSQSLLKNRYSNLAEACGEAAVDLRSVKAGEIGEGEVADALQELVGKLPGLLEDAKETFQGAADAFEAWGEALDTARQESYSVLTDAQTAYEALEDKDDWDDDREIYVTRLNTVLSTMSGDVDTAVNALDELMRNGWDKAWDLWNKVVEWTEENPLVYAALMVVAGIAAIFIPGFGIGIALGIIGLLVSATSLHRQDKLGFNLHSAAVLGFDAIGVVPGGAFVRGGAAMGGRFLSSQRGPISSGLRSTADSIRHSPLGTSVSSTLNRGSEIRQSINSGTFNNSPRQSLAANAALGGFRDGGIGAAGGAAAEVTDTGDSSFSSVAQAAGLGFTTGAPTGAIDGAHSNNGFQAAWQGDSSVLSGGGADTGGGVDAGAATDVGGATDTGGTTDVSGTTDGGGATTSASEGVTGGDSSGTGSTPTDVSTGGAPSSGESLSSGADTGGAPASGETPVPAEAPTTAEPASAAEATPDAPASETPTADPTPAPEPVTPAEAPATPEAPAASASEAPPQDTGAPEGPASEGGAPGSPATDTPSTDAPATEGPASSDRSPEPTTPAEPTAADTSLETPAQGEPTPDASSHPSPESGDTPSQAPVQPSGDPANPAPGEGAEPGSRPGDAESPTLTSPEGQGDQSGQPTSGPEGSSDGRSDGSQAEAGGADAAARRTPAATEPQPASSHRPAPEGGPDPSPASGEGRPGGQDAPHRPVERPVGQPAGEQPRGGDAETSRGESQRGDDTATKPRQGHRDENGNHTDPDRSGGRDGDDTGTATPQEDQSAEPTADNGSGGDKGGDEPPRTGGDGDDAESGDQGPENQPPQSILDAGLDTQNGRFPKAPRAETPGVRWRTIPFRQETGCKNLLRTEEFSVSSRNIESIETRMTEIASLRLTAAPSRSGSTTSRWRELMRWPGQRKMTQESLRVTWEEKER